MSQKIQSLKTIVGRANANHLRVALVILSLAMFVIGAGAPADGSGWGG